jgi:hypothetical protein
VLKEPPHSQPLHLRGGKEALRSLSIHHSNALRHGSSRRAILFIDLFYSDLTTPSTDRPTQNLGKKALFSPSPNLERGVLWILGAATGSSAAQQLFFFLSKMVD